MLDYIEIGAVPADEPCAGVGSEDYAHQARKECKAFIAQLRRTFGEPPGSAFFKVRANPHDFGTYYEVACYYDDEDEAAIEYAIRCENEMPLRWDKEAREVLGLGVA